MASINGVTIRFDQIKGFRRNNKGMREVRCFPELQSLLIDKCLTMAEILNSTFDGQYDVGPNYFESGSSDWEPVTGNRHNPPMGAHAFVRTDDAIAAEEEAEMHVLNWLL